ALTGIIMVQVLWLRNAINIQEISFDQNVGEALSEAVNKIEKKETAKVFMRYHIDKDTDSRDTMLYNLSTCSTEVPGTEILMILKDSHRLENTVHISSCLDETANNPECRSLNIIRHKSDSFRINMLSDKDDSLKILIEEVFDQKEKKVSIVLSEIMHELEYRDITADKRIDSTILRQQIVRALSEKNITIDFHIFVTSNGIPVPSLSDRNIIDTVRSYTVPLFPGDVVENKDLLYIYFPGKTNYIVRNIAVPAIGSVLFTLIILAVFIYSLRTILRQKKLSDVKSDFINNMTHEFKTPIATIALAADSIENQKVISDKERILYYTGIIKEENNRMNSQVENILQAALTEKHDFKPDLELLDTHEMIREAIRKIKIRMGFGEEVIQMKPDAENSHIYADNNLFTNIIYNLLDNACKYSTGIPEILITTSNDKDLLFISVQDKGTGMSRDVQEKIFEKFYRKPSGNIHDVKGHGLGLSYVKAMTEAFGGHIKLYSEPGKGSTFYIFFPFVIKNSNPN
ncbi:MAG: HAMP domain-containing sensor histidine kinase, partial [Bacteroidota bacterium]